MPAGVRFATGDSVEERALERLWSAIEEGGDVEATLASVAEDVTAADRPLADPELKGPPLWGRLEARFRIEALAVDVLCGVAPRPGVTRPKADIEWARRSATGAVYDLVSQASAIEFVDRLRCAAGLDLLSRGWVRSGRRALHPGP